MWVLPFHVSVHTWPLHRTHLPPSLPPLSLSPSLPPFPLCSFYLVRVTLEKCIIYMYIPATVFCSFPPQWRSLVPRGGFTRSLITQVCHRNCTMPTQPTSTRWVSISPYKLCINLYARWLWCACSVWPAMHGILIVRNLLCLVPLFLSAIFPHDRHMTGPFSNTHTHTHTHTYRRCSVCGRQWEQYCEMCQYQGWWCEGCSGRGHWSTGIIITCAYMYIHVHVYVHIIIGSLRCTCNYDVICLHIHVYTCTCICILVI